MGHFAGFWKFGSRPSLSETPPERQAPDTLGAMWTVKIENWYNIKRKIYEQQIISKIKQYNRSYFNNPIGLLGIYIHKHYSFRTKSI